MTRITHVWFHLRMAHLVLLTTGTVAERFGVSRETVRRWSEGGQLPPHVVTAGGHRRYLAKDVDALAAERAR